MSFRALTISFAFSLLLFYGAVVASVLPFLKSVDFSAVLSSPRVVYAVKLSLTTALCATALSLVFAVPAGYALSRHKFPGRAVVDAILEIPLIVSPIALGALLIMLFKTRAGILIEENIGSFIFEVRGIILAQFVTSAGIATRTMKAVFDEISPRYEMVACSLGATPLQSFMTVTFPLARKGLLAAAAITFAKCVGEFGATMTFAGTMPMKTETLPIGIFLSLSSAKIDETALLIIILIAIGLSTILLTKACGAARHD